MWQEIHNYTSHQVCEHCKWICNPIPLKYERKTNNSSSNSPERIRAGVFMYNPQENKILVVQVYNQYFGLPKGGQEKNESLSETAIRELHEETGILLKHINISKRLTLHRTCTYFIIETTESYPLKIHSFPENDVSGVGWIHVDCINKLPGTVTSHLKTCIEKLIKKKKVAVHK